MKFEDTPEWKRSARWNAREERLEYPPTPRQIKYLKLLCKRAGTTYREPASKAQAQSMIQKTKNRIERQAARPYTLADAARRLTDATGADSAASAPRARRTA